jgi:hypothetical protein
LSARHSFAVVVLLGMAAAAGCTITDVVTEEGTDLLVVEAVLRTDMSQQRVLLHPSLTSDTTAVERNAQVVVRMASGREILFRPATEIDLCLESGASLQAACYVSSMTEGPWVQPGQTYELSITTQDGRRVFGRTQVPGAFQFLRPRSACRLPPNTPLPLAWSRSAGAWSYLADLEIRHLPAALAGQVTGPIPDPLNLQGLSISEADTTMTLPSDFGVFQRTDFEQPLLRALQGGLPAGTTARLVLAAVDRNYVNAVRGGSFNPSGRVRVPSVTGDGTGFFGSIVPRAVAIEVQVQGSAPPCLPQ